MSEVEKQLYEIIKKAIPTLPKIQPSYVELVKLLYSKDNGELLPQTIISCELLMLISGSNYISSDHPSEILSITPHSLHITSLPSTAHFPETVPLIIREYQRILSASTIFEELMDIEISVIKKILLQTLLHTIILFTSNICLSELLSLLSDCITSETVGSIIDLSTNCPPLQTLFSSLSIRSTISPSIRYSAARKFLFPTTYYFISLSVFGNSPIAVQNEFENLISSDDLNGIIALLQFAGEYGRLSGKVLIDDSHCLIALQKGISQGIMELCVSSLDALSALKFGYSSLVSVGYSCFQNNGVQTILSFNEFREQYFIVLKKYIESISKFDKNPLIPIIEIIQNDLLILFKFDISKPDDIEVLFDAAEFLHIDAKPMTSAVTSYVLSHVNHYSNKAGLIVRMLKYITFDQKCPIVLISAIKKIILNNKTVEILKVLSYLIESNPVYSDSSILNERGIEELMEQFGESQEVLDFMVVIMKCKLHINIRCMSKMISSILKGRIGEKEEQIIKFFLENGGVLPEVDYCPERPKIVALLKKYGVRGDCKLLLSQAIKAVRDKSGDMTVMIIHQWVENGGTGSVDEFIMEGLKVFEFCPREVCGAILELVISSQWNSGITINFAQLFNQQTIARLEKYPTIETVVALVNVVEKINHGNVKMCFKINEDYAPGELNEEQLLILLKSQKDCGSYLWSRRDKMINYIGINPDSSESEIELVYYILKKINESIRGDFEMWKGSCEEIINKVISNCLVLKKINHECNGMKEVVKTIGFVDVVLEGFKFILSLQQIQRDKVIQQTQTEYIIKVIEDKWCVEMKKYVLLMKVLGLKIVKFIFGKNEKTKELEQKLKEELNVTEIDESEISQSLLKSLIE